MNMDQMVENINVRQRENEGYRRWFVNSEFDLIIWYDKKGGELYGFQLCYEKTKHEKAFTCTKEYTSSHKVRDAGTEIGIPHQSTGILKDDGGNISEETILRFKNESNNVEIAIRDLIIKRINEYNSLKK
jgi:hypothetical protein